MMVDKKGHVANAINCVTFGFWSSLLCSCDPKVNAFSRI